MRLASEDIAASRCGTAYRANVVRDKLLPPAWGPTAAMPLTTRQADKAAMSDEVLACTFQ